MTRDYAFAGQFYPADVNQLKEQIKKCFEGKLGPAKFKPIKQKVCGIICPHAGYVFSGQCAAWSYKAIEKQNYDTFIILGVNHGGLGSKIAISLEDFSTPLGIAKNDVAFSEKVLGKLGEHEDAVTHLNEHSIEVQLPFLQHVFKNPSFVPILLGGCNFDDCKKLAIAIAETAKEMKKKVCIIASTDFTHYGLSYNFVPFPPVKDDIYALDKKAIKPILKLNSPKFLQEAEKTTICGQMPIVTCIEACKILGSKKAEFLKYYTSADLMGDYRTAVGYASIIFK